MAIDVRDEEHLYKTVADAAEIDAALCGAFGKVLAKQLPTRLLAGHAEAATPDAKLTFEQAGYPRSYVAGMTHVHRAQNRQRISQRFTRFDQPRLCP